MAVIARVRVGWSGVGLVGPGVSTFYFDQDQVASCRAALVTLFGAVRAYLPTKVTVTVPTTGELIESTTGAPLGVWNAGASDAAIVGTSATAFAAGVGLRIVWSTQGFRGNRRVIGSTYIVPINTSSYDTDGSLTPGTVGEFMTALAAFQVGSGGSQQIWSPAKDGAGGQASTVTGFAVPDKVSWLRSRRT